MRKYSIVINQHSKEPLLQIDGMDSYCPYVAPIPMQGQMGVPQLVRFPCSRQCPHFCLDVENKKLKLMCSAMPNEMELESIQTEIPEKSVFAIK